MAGYGVKQAIQDARIAKGHKAEENSCGDCGAPIARNEVLCRECRADVAEAMAYGNVRGCRVGRPFGLA